MDIFSICPIVNEFRQVRTFLIIGIATLGTIIPTLYPIPILSNIARKIIKQIIAHIKAFIISIAGLISFAVLYKFLFCLT